MNNLKVIFLCLCTFWSYTASGQEAPTFTWWNPIKNAFPVVEGQAWSKEVKEPYSRFPARAEKTVRKEVWDLSQNSAGLMVRFKTNADKITIRYAVTGGLAMNHMPATGASGIDLYAIDADGKWLWCAGKYSFKDTIQYQFTNLEPSDKYHKKGREYRLYLPLYNSVKWLEVGVPSKVEFTPLPVRLDKPIAVYGTSVAQGACASRPGMAWTAILERKMDRPLINIGISSHGRLDKEVVDLMTEIDAAVFVFDNLPNVASRSGLKPEEVHNRIMYAVKATRQKWPRTPIILTEHFGYADALINPVVRQEYIEINNVQRQAFTQLKSEGYQNLYLLTKEEINQDINSMVDGKHPTDLGMMRYAEAYENLLRLVLNEPIGPYTSTKPCTQYRNASLYDWETRHREIVTAVKTNSPKAIFLGNSITHFWGGSVGGGNAQGSASWNAVLKPTGVYNLGYGWDRIENVLWRVYHGELDGYTAQQAILLIGTNNLALNSNAEIVAGLTLLVQAIKIRQPGISILLMGILPRRNEEKRIAELNSEIVRAAGLLNVNFTDAGNAFVHADGKIKEALFSDGLHPNAVGYELLANYIKPHLLKSTSKTNKKSKVGKS